MTVFSQYARTETGDARVGRLSCAGAGRKNTDGETGHQMAGGEGGADSMCVYNNNRGSLGP